MKKLYSIPLNLGTLCGLILFAIFLLLQAFDLSPFLFYRVIGVPVVIAAIILALYKVKQLVDPPYTFSRAFYSGTLTTLVLAMLKAILVYLYLSFISNAPFLQFRVKYGNIIKKLKDAGIMEEEAYKNAIEQLQKTTIESLAFNEFNLNVFAGMIVSLIAALIFMQKKKNHQPKVQTKD